LQEEDMTNDVDCRPGRRRLLTLAGGLLLARAAGAAPGCVLTPEQTEGPYFVDVRLNRSDIRADVRSGPGAGVVAAGVPLALALRVLDTGAGCRPVAGALVDIWHCDAAGVYSDAVDPGFDSRGHTFLRGYQVSGSDGVLRFLTIYPGWYRGRAVHIHFKVRTSTGGEFTSQLYFDEAVTDEAHAHAAYRGRTGRRLPNAADGIFRDGGSHLLLSPQRHGDGYAAAFDIGLKTV
jgi:protocatechuate 3,4-dioxygenase beta subunit